MEHSSIFAGIRAVLTGLELRMGHLEARLDTRIDSLERRMDTRFEQVEHKLDQRFAWLIGLQVTTILAFVGSAIALAAR